ncbi:hypothetical protein E4J66_13995 [Actinomyces viscosus]|nr:hypothetical protein [Actinomyces viscosus]TFH50768.1 hypothetical protein E4J66_13995 [Actinomyces viscosus]
MTEERHGSGVAGVYVSGNTVPQNFGNQSSGGGVAKILLWVVVAVVVVATAAGVGGWVWSTHMGAVGGSQATEKPPSPLKSTPLPSGVERGEVITLGGSLPSENTDKGILESAGMHVENNRWVGSVRWIPIGGESVKYDLPLGKSVHIDGLGTVTLFSVTPPSTAPPDKTKSGGSTSTLHINVNLDPGESFHP